MSKEFLLQQQFKHGSLITEQFRPLGASVQQTWFSFCEKNTSNLCHTLCHHPVKVKLKLAQ